MNEKREEGDVKSPYKDNTRKKKNIAGNFLLHLWNEWIRIGHEILCKEEELFRKLTG